LRLRLKELMDGKILMSFHPHHCLLIFMSVRVLHTVSIGCYVKIYCSHKSSSVHQCSSTFLLEWNPLERLDCSRNPHSDVRVCSIPNGQKQHFSVLCNLHEKTSIDAGVCVSLYL